jgi:hypothetical protein
MTGLVSVMGTPIQVEAGDVVKVVKTGERFRIYHREGGMLLVRGGTLVCSSCGKEQYQEVCACGIYNEHPLPERSQSDGGLR